MQMNSQKTNAIDLMIEDLYTAHPDIRTRAKGEGCENELNAIRNQLLDYLNHLKEQK